MVTQMLVQLCMQQVGGSMVSHGVKSSHPIHFDHGSIASLGGTLFHGADVNDHARSGAPYFIHTDLPGAIFGYDLPAIANLSTRFYIETGFG
ncbi:hypothetical protein SDC9_163046 [bioreactor metagenome]|uniref:Uncharacterized protein n=1 Tax=bioreactor metagenome TaxID=1076179 RepID=A0A645FQ42_9ZZZZ